MLEPAVQVEPIPSVDAESPALAEISVMVDAGGAHAFSIVLSADGTIRRRHAGTGDSPGLDMVIGTAHPELFDQVRSMITPELLKWCRPLRPAAALCGELRELEVRLKHADGHEVMSRWQHDADALGPPSQVIEFAAATVAATNSWYEQEKKRQRRPRSRGRPGWHLVS